MKTEEESLKEAFVWVGKAIEGCTNQFHLDGSTALINLFYAMYKDEEHTDLLKLLLQEKKYKIYHIIN